MGVGCVAQASLISDSTVRKLQNPTKGDEKLRLRDNEYFSHNTKILWDAGVLIAMADYDDITQLLR